MILVIFHIRYIITEGTQILVGGDDIYTPLCRKCWKNKIKEKMLRN